MDAARFPVHRDLAGFDFDVSVVYQKLATLGFTEAAHNVVLVGDPGVAFVRGWRSHLERSGAGGNDPVHEGIDGHDGKRSRGASAPVQRRTQAAGAERM
ncbi:hypothetical protein D9M72_587640 [compost metagenome]